MANQYEDSFENGFSQPTSGRASLNMRDYMQILLERLWIWVTVFVAVTTAAVFYTGKKVPLYRASARIQMDVPQAKVVEADNVVSVNPRDFAYIHTQVKILESYSLAEKVAETLDLANHKVLGSRGGAHKDYGAMLAGATRIALVTGTRMVDVAAEHTDPEIAVLIADGIADGYVKQNLERRMESSLEALTWLRQQAEIYKSRLESSELALQEYREKTLSTSLVNRHNVEVSKLQDITTSLTKAESTLLHAETEWLKVKKLMDSEEPYDSLEIVASDDLVHGTEAQVLEKKTEIGVLRSRYKDKHPTMLRALRELDELQAQYKRACLAAAENVHQAFILAKETEAALQKELTRQQKKTLEFDRKLMAYNELLRDVDADTELYKSILARMKETSVSGQLEMNNVRVVDHAREPGAPFNISRRRDVTRASLLGLLLGLGLAYLVHFTDDRIRRTEELEHGMGVPVLAVVPKISAKGGRARACIAQLDGQTAAAESFRTLRASLALSPAAKKAHQLMITSAETSAGKSLVSSNLAIVFAHNGLRTLLIDADLRRPSQHRAFETDRETGLSHVLAGDMPWRDIRTRTDTPNLDLIEVGRIPPNPAELLGSPAMTQLLEEAGQEYDKVILDAPPVFGLSDPFVLLPQVEGVIFIAMFNKSRRRSISHAVQKLREGETPILGCVMNGVDLGRPSGYYYYYQHYGYYYNSYGQKKHKKT
ncbi:MAG: polysaccharide biosynthesis tyrosine autokinase [Kiritimatiellia bacterium]|jgi:capsular exopolysaccharide synthesis family protein|nr:polysaccharide biosynthesis tyrosine autokinase [Kiritimatiellia bacterium]MDP6848786.1 polysaccharide biosynthesis tyrosine autokinase [Kiritimatiellia bacterium]